MPSIHRFALWLLLFCLGSFVTILVLVPLLLSLIGYQVNASSSTVAEAAAKKRDVSLCKTILSYGLLRPQSGELRSHCVKTYASLTKDPSVCELLMPSSYGWSCLGAAMDHRLCIIGEGPENTVRGQGKITTYDACVSGDAETKAYSCCVMARILQEKNETRDCTSLKTVELKDECHYFIAQKRMDANECSLIVSERTRIGCGVAVRALLK